MECTSCKYKKQISLKRCKHFELGGEKKKSVNILKYFKHIISYKIKFSSNKIELRTTMVNLDYGLCFFFLRIMFVKWLCSLLCEKLKLN